MRWWADPEESRANLALVDDSDVANGVMTAVLAYHGMAAEVLEPLSKSTLQDADSVTRGLEAMDISPLADALAKATRPVMGDAADHYGYMLARDIHADATEATGRLVVTLATSGVSFPQAIERAACVHGVPIERLGMVATKLRQPVVPELTRLDIGDRALMEFAHHVGEREATTEVISKGQTQKAPDAEFDPNDHPRGRYGQFVSAGRLPDNAMQERQIRRDRHKRHQSLREKASASRQKTSDSIASLGSLWSMFTTKEESAQEAKQETRAEKKSLTQIRRDQRKARTGRLQSVSDQDTDEDQMSSQRVMRSGSEYVIDRGQRFAMIPRAIAYQIMNTPGIQAAEIHALVGHDLDWMSGEDMQGEVAQIAQSTSFGAPYALQDRVILAIDGDFVTEEGDAHDDTLKMAPAAELGVAHKTKMVEEQFHVSGEYPTFYASRTSRANPAFDDELGKYVPVVGLKTTNTDVFTDQHEAEIEYAESRPKMSRKPLQRKTTQKKSRFQFEEADVERDNLGRFADQGSNAPDAVAARRERHKRHVRHQKLRSKARMSAKPAEQQREPMRLSDFMRAEEATADKPSRASRMQQARRDQHRKRVAPASKGQVNDDSTTAPEWLKDAKTLTAKVLTNDQIQAWEDNAREMEEDPTVTYANIYTDPHHKAKTLAEASTEINVSIAKERSTRSKRIQRGEVNLNTGVWFANPAAAIADGERYAGVIKAAAKNDDKMYAWGTSQDQRITASQANRLRVFAVEEQLDNGQIGWTARAAVDQVESTPTILLGSPKDHLRMRNSDAPETFVMEEVYYRDLAKASGVKPEEYLSSPDVLVRVIRPVFGHNDE